MIKFLRADQHLPLSKHEATLFANFAVAQQAAEYFSQAPPFLETEHNLRVAYLLVQGILVPGPNHDTHAVLCNNESIM